MAPTLQCPECGNREPVENVSQRDEFRCGGCGRALKVPESLRRRQEGELVGQSPDRAVDAARIFASSEGTADAAHDGHAEHPMSRVERESLAAKAYAPSLPIWVRLAIWAVWLPFGLLATFYIAIKLRWLNEDHLFGTLGKVTWDRFVPIGRLLPLAALIVAILVHGTILLLERRIGKQRLNEMLARGATDLPE